MGVLVKLISELNSTLGVAPCIVVSHDVPEVLTLRITPIVADKKIVAHGSAQSLREIAIRACASSLMASLTARCRSAILRAITTMIY